MAKMWKLHQNGLKNCIKDSGRLKGSFFTWFILSFFIIDIIQNYHWTWKGQSSYFFFYLPLDLLAVFYGP